MDLLTLAMANALAKQYTDAQLEDLGMESITYHFCVSGEYNTTSGVPTVTNPDSNTFYFVPAVSGNGLFNVYIYKNNWVLFTSTEMDLSNMPVDDSLSESGMAADAKKTGDEITALKDDLREYYYPKTALDVNGIITWPTEWGYPSLSGGTYTWNASQSYVSTKRTSPVKVKRGDKIHLLGTPGHVYFAIYSADGITWESFTVTTAAINKTVANDGYVIISVRKNPVAVITEAERASMFENIEIVREGYSNKALELSKGIETAINMGNGIQIVCNEESYTWCWISAKETEQLVVGSDLIGGNRFDVAVGDKFRLWGDITTNIPANFSSIGVAVVEKNAGGTTLNTTRFYDFSMAQEFIITNANTATIEMVVIAISPSIDTGYNVNFYYHVVLCRVKDAFDEVLTESGDAWEV